MNNSNKHNLGANSFYTHSENLPGFIYRTYSAARRDDLAVRDAHSVGVVHRDIKPDNVIVTPDGTKAYLIDFGICQYSEGELTFLTTNEAFGNPAFAAPETFLGREEEPGAPCDIYSLGKLLYWLVSRGRYISRERLSPAILERIETKHHAVRFYLGRLLRGTVVEDPAQRWTDSRLLEEVRVTRSLIERVRRYEDRGQIILTDGFGPDDSFSRSGSRSAMKDRGNPPGDNDVATKFEVFADHDVYLEAINLAISYKAGEDELDVWLTPDLDGKPDVQNILEAFRNFGDGSYGPRVEAVQSHAHPCLQRGRCYWILLSAPAPYSEIALWAVPPGFEARTVIAERLDGGQWQGGEASSGYAIWVIGRPAEH